MAVGSYPKNGDNRPGLAMAGRVVGAVVGPLVNPVVDQMDVNELVNRVDVNEVIQRVDMNELLERVDLEGVIDRVDLNQVLAGVDLNRLLERVDVNELVDRIDLDPVIDRVDLNEVLGRVDVNAVVQRIDVNAVVDKVDITHVLEQVDIEAVISNTEFGSLIAKSTTKMFSKALDALRAWVITLDVLVQGFVDRVFRKRRPAIAAQPPANGTTGTTRSQARLARAVAFQGVPAGMVSRLFAFLVDVLAIDVLFSLGSAAYSLLNQLFTGHMWQLRNHQTSAIVTLAVFVFLYFTIPVAVAGRTFGQTIMGLRVLRTDEGDVDGWHATLRTLTFPFSILLFGIGVLMGLLRSDRRMLQDVTAGTEEVYDWDAQAARLRALAERPAGAGTPGAAGPQTTGASSRAASP